MLSERLKYTSSISGEKSYYRILEKHESIIDFLNHYTGKLLTISNAALSRPPTEYEKEEFLDMSYVLRTDPWMKQAHSDWGENYICGILITKIKKVNMNEVPDYDRTSSLARDTSKISTYYNYISTELDLSKTTFEKAIKVDQYAKDECWINTIYDFYGDNLLSCDKKRNVITREIILEIIGKTEDTIKSGLSIDDMRPFFVKFKLSVRVFDKFYKLVFRYDPPVRNNNNKTLYCMMDGNHIYTLNHDIKKLEQHLDVDLDYEIKPSSDYKVKKDDDDEQTIDHIMISTIDDIITILNKFEDSKEEKTIYLIHKDDNLTAMLYNLLEKGYQPNVKYETGRITHIIMKFNTHLFILRTQQLITSVIQYPIVVDSEAVYNKMNEAMVNFNRQIFKGTHKSYYNKQDIDILDEYRTIANLGMIKKNPLAQKLNEIDVSKAYTAAFTNMTKIPVFNEFDIFQPYENEQIKDLNLYIVKSKNLSMMFNKVYNLVYGKFLNHFKDVEILAFKEPSSIKKVDYKKIVEDLYNFSISENNEEDIYIKKLIANINYGLLEKSKINNREHLYLII